jgi:hypothetical protein
MIPTKAVGPPRILVAADEVQARYYLGLFVARPVYLTSGQKLVAKKNVSAQRLTHIL